MSARPISGEGSLGARRGEVVVCLAADRATPEAITATVHAILATSHEGIRVLVHGGGPGAGGAEDRVAVLAELGEATADLAGAASAAAPADIVAVRAGCTVSGEWLARLRAAAHARADIATASAVSIESLLGPATPNAPALDPAAAAVAARAPRLRAALAAPGGPCVYIRRSAIELTDALPGDDFADRCHRAGLAHVLADDVLVAGGGSAGPLPPLVPEDGAAADGAVGGAQAAGPLVRSLASARRAIGTMHVAIDARELARSPDGTRLHLTEVIAAVAATARVRLSAVVTDRLDAQTRERLQAVTGVELVALDSLGRLPGGRRADLVHRPHQLSTPADLAVLAGLGERLVITQQDLIGYHQPGYFPSPAAWARYRGLTRRSLAVADRVVFFSAHVRDDALAEGLIDPARGDVVAIGVDHRASASAAAEEPAGGGVLREGGEMMLCLGTDLVHKNRVFALRVAAELRRRHDWRGHLVLAGPHVRHGDSRAQEGALLEADPGLREAVLELGVVSEPEKEWLLQRASVVLYPSLHEGFGLIPFEAAARGVPCLWAPGTALSELLPDDAAGIAPWSAAATAERARALMLDAAAREAAVGVVAERAATLRWERTGERLAEVYERACADPPAPAGDLERLTGLMRGGLSEDALRLVGPGGALPRDVERPLLALATRPRIAAPLFGALRASYRLARRRASDA